ncbi:2-succinyl-6-hydroxy-2,4-cyclohexadiene-1-carboxylate synthase [Ureibacillus acetophenoni]
MMVSVRGVNYHVQVWNENAKDSLVILHGFTGSVVTWEKVSSLLPTTMKIIAIDLLGHGKTDAPSNELRYSMEEQVEDLEDLFKQLDLHSFILVGYSMGGRVALSYISAYPERVKSLILESALPGLKTEEERANRRNSDEALANKIEQNGIVSFVNAWENISLFETQKKLSKDTQLAIRNERLAQREVGLANSLRGMGTGAQKSLWPLLNQITTPVYLITGELDEKFCLIAQEMMDELPNAKHMIIAEVGHAIHVENPTQFATIIKDVYHNN